jgi:hypothetical protein
MNFLFAIHNNSRELDWYQIGQKKLDRAKEMRLIENDRIDWKKSNGLKG